MKDVTEFTTSQPKLPVVDKEKTKTDDETGICLTLLRFANAGDYSGFRGPATEEFFCNGDYATTVNICNKDFTAMFKKGSPKSEYSCHIKKAFENTSYIKDKFFGPFFVVAMEEDTLYFCVRVKDKFHPLTSEVVSLKKGSNFSTKKYLGYNLVVLKGCLGSNLVGSLLRIESDTKVKVTEPTKILLVKKEKVS